MFTKTTLALIIIAGTASGALAATKHQSVAPHVVPNQDVYDMRGKYIGTDPNSTVRFELRRDSDHSHP